MRKCAVSFTLALISGCSQTSDIVIKSASPLADEIVVSDAHSHLSGSIRIGLVEGLSCTDEKTKISAATQDMLNKAAILGATHVMGFRSGDSGLTLKCISGGGFARGIAYRLPVNAPTYEKETEK